ncbi:ABC transporter permease subunit [Actinocorallia sp. API 0066]|uniref:ABC transporter permease subunit n=1 Tax=Actinocorallia sp. API 0066 TaxID=2896846 RepID=UPI001E39D529|nr:ABC transporter permease subunit [Actinocorallia sp. API 0066]MCD0450497.1 ABC transporter permease subunit [Actinocorallia sp. API 0066]
MTQDTVAGARSAAPRPSPPSPPPRREWSAHPGAIAGRVVTAGALAGIGLWTAAPLWADRHWAGLACVVAVTAAALAVYLSPKRLPGKYLFPTTLLIVLFQLFPIGYTLSLAATNVGDGHLGTKAEAVTAIETSSVRRDPDSPEFRLTVGERDGALVFLLTEPGRRDVRLGDADGLRPLPGARTNTGGRVVEAPGVRVLTAAEAATRGRELTRIVVPVPGGGIRSQGLTRAYQGTAGSRYDASCDCVVSDGRRYHADEGEGRFVAADGTALDQGWKVGVGLANLTAVFTDSRLGADVVGVFAWNLGYAVAVVVVSAALGIALALALHHPFMRGVRIYRTLVVLPYAMPAFAMLLVWRDMFNTDFGLVNRLLGLDVDWLGTGLTARLSVILVQTWLGFPYMFLVATGALQSIPGSYLEAAKVDGAGAWQRFRAITLPLLMLALAPLLVSSFAFNFNNFNGIFLITSGGPFPADDPTVGATDLLITYTYRMAFGQQGADYGLAAAMSVYVYLIVALLSIVSFRRTNAFREVDR